MAAATALSPQLLRAFERWQAAPPERAQPRYPRAVRLGIDYALRVTIADARTDAACDAIAAACMDLSTMEAADPPGDPPATCEAHAKAERAGPECGQAFDLLGRLRDTQDALRAHGYEVPDLPDEAWMVLQRAARGERVKPEAIGPVLRQAQLLADQFSLQVLKLPR